MTGVSAAENIISFIDSPEKNSIGDKEFKNEREFDRFLFYSFLLNNLFIKSLFILFLTVL